MPPKILDGRYEIHEPLGAGGMARVFRGLDVELRRPVAIKLLPEDRAQDEHLRARMVREAQGARNRRRGRPRSARSGANPTRSRRR